MNREFYELILLKINEHNLWFLQWTHFIVFINLLNHVTLKYRLKFKKGKNASSD